MNARLYGEEGDGKATIDENLDEALRLLNGCPIVDPADYFEARTENLLASIAHSLVVIAHLAAGRPLPDPPDDDEDGSGS